MMLLSIGTRCCLQWSRHQRTLTTFNKSIFTNSYLLLPSQQEDKVQSSPSSVSMALNTHRLSVGDRIIRFIGWMGGFYSRKAILTRSANSLYEQCIDEIDYESFFQECNMPDSFQSWFLVAHLHIWLCLARLKREGKDGSYIIRQLVSFFWKDVEGRMKQLGVSSGRIANQSLRELDKEFRGLIIAYEEGLLTDDRRLASAIWRNFIEDKSRTDMESIATLVHYIRSQVKEMDGTSLQDIKVNGKMNLMPLTLRKCSS